MPHITEITLKTRHSNYSSHLGYSSYLKIIILTVVFGSCSCGLGFYWEIILLTSSYPHLSYQLVFILAVTIGSYAAAFVLPLWGRRRPLIYHMLPMYPAYVLNALYQGEHWCDLLTRLLAGIAIGAHLTTACVYLAEISLARCRGRNYALMVFSCWCGMALYMLLYRVNPYFSLVILLFPLSFMCLAWEYLPETPYYVMQVNEQEFSAEVLHFLRCGPLMYKEMEYLSIARFVFGYDRSSFWTFARRWQVLDRAWTSCLMVVLVHLTGFPIFIINFKLISAHVPGSWNTENLVPLDAIQLRPYDLVCFVAIVFVSICGFLIYYFTIDKWRRSWLMGCSFLGTNLCLIAMCVYFYLLTSTNLSIVLLYICTPLYFFAYFAGQAYLPFLLIGEIFPHHLKHGFCAFGISAYFFFMSFSYFLVRMIVMNVGPFCTCLYFAATNFIGICFALLLIPSYTNYSLEAVQEYFDGFHRPYVWMDNVEVASN